MKKIISTAEKRDLEYVYKFAYMGKRNEPLITKEWYANLQEAYVGLANECYDVGVKPIQLDFTERLETRVTTTTVVSTGISPDNSIASEIVAKMGLNECNFRED